MKTDVFFIKKIEGEDDASLCLRLEKALREKDFLAFIGANDYVALKTHFGEQGTQGYVRPLFLKMLGQLVREKKGRPFLTETSTLYTGKRSNAIGHLEHAQEHGFGFEHTGMPIVMADGLLGNEEEEVAIPGKLYQKVNLASGIVRANALVLVSHFTGHLATGFGAALKNLGMGCSSRKGKLNQHSTAKPSIKKDKCTGCGECLPWCPEQAISLPDAIAVIDSEKCIGCGECLTVCRYGAIGYNWGATYLELQQKVTEHAFGVVKTKPGKLLCLNFLTRITKDCDCLANTYHEIVPDIGVLVSTDPVVLDAASLDLVEQRAGKPLGQIAFDIPCREQLEHARSIGFGSAEYRLQEIVVKA